MRALGGFVCSLAGALTFSLSLAIAYSQNEAHKLATAQSIGYGLILALGFVLMMVGFRLARWLIFVDAAVLVLVFAYFHPIVRSEKTTTALFNDATSLYRADRFSEAIALFERYLGKNPNDALANARIAVCLGQLGRLQESIPYLQKAIALDPADYQSRSNLGLVYEKLSRPEEGLGWARQADKIKPNDPAVLNNLGWVLWRAGHDGEAVTVFQRAVRLAPNVKLYRENLEKARKDAALRPPF